jgi:hypothetical protein
VYGCLERKEGRMRWDGSREREREREEREEKKSEGCV